MENNEIPLWSGGFQFIRGDAAADIFIFVVWFTRDMLSTLYSEYNVYLSRNVTINIKMHPAFVVVTVEDDGVAGPTVRKRVTVMECWLEFGANRTKS